MIFLIKAIDKFFWVFIVLVFMKRTLFLLTVISSLSPSLALAGGGNNVFFATGLSETIIWDADATYNKPYTVTDKNTYEFIFQGDSEDTFIFQNNTQGIFYVKPNGSAGISFSGAESKPNVNFHGNSVNKGTTTSPINGSVLNDYNGNVKFSNLGELTLSGNTADGSGGGIYFYGGSLEFSHIDSLLFQGNTADEAGGAIGSANGNISFSNIIGDITFAENTAHCKSGGIKSGSAIYSYGGKILFQDIGGRILVSKNVDDSKGAAIRGGTVTFSNVRGGLEFSENESRAISSAGAIVFDHIEKGVVFDGNDAGSGQGGAIASEVAVGSLAISFSEISGGISFKNNTGNTGGAISAVNSGTVSFDKVSGGITFENNVVKSGPAGALRSGALDMTNVTGDVVFRNNRTAQDSTSANYGGALHVSNGAVRFDGIQGNVVMDGNQAISTGTTRGGVMWVTEDISMSNVSGDILVTNNSAMGGSEGTGGAFFSRNAGVSLSADGNIVFQGNSAKSAAGAIKAAKSVSMTSKQGDIIIANNTAGSSAGAINASGGITLTAERGNINVSNNSAGSSTGGALYSLSGVVNIQAREGKTSFVGNAAKGDGGAIYAGTVNVTAGKNGVEFLNNTSSTGQGGAISVSNELNLTAQGGNILFAGNKGGADGQQVGIFTRTNYSSSSVPVINLNASAGRSIIMEDAIKAGKDLTININKGVNGVSSEGLVHFKGNSGSIFGSATSGAVLTLNVESGTTIVEGHIEGSGSVNVGSTATLMSGYTSLVKGEDGTMSLSSTTGFESFIGNLVFQEGAKLGTNIRNESAETWTINMDDLSQSVAAAWGDKGTNATSSNSANVIGNVILSNARVQADDVLHVGEGASVELVEMGAGSSVSTSGGTVDVTKAGVSDAVLGSYDSTISKTSSAQIRIDSTKESTVKGTSLLAEENTTTTINKGSTVIADQITVTNATLENNGNLASVGQLTVTDGTLKGSGAFGNVDVQKGLVIVGNSPGSQVFENLNLGSEATMIFSIGGIIANDGINTGWASESYSNIDVNHQLSLVSGTTFTLELGSEFLVSLVNGKEYTFNLVFFETLTGDVNDINLAYTVYNQETQTSSSIANPFENGQFSVTGNTIQFTGIAASASVPEPSTATMSLLALAMLTMTRRRSR